MTDTANPMSPLNATLRLAGGFLLGMFGAGVGVGVIAAIRDNGRFGMGGALGIGLALLALGGAAWMILSIRGHFRLPRSPRVRRSRIAFYLSLGISLVVGLFAGVAGITMSDLETGNPAAGLHILTGSTPIAPSVALIALIGWVLAMVFSLFWHLSLDEIERAEYDYGGVIALYAYLLCTPAWWLAWRGGMAPAPDTMVIFLLVCAVWCIGWGWRRYR